MGKQLTVSSMNKTHAKEFGAPKKVVLSSGDYILVQTKFKVTSVQKLLLDYYDILEQMKQKELNITTMKNSAFIFYMLLLRHFTNLSNIPNEIEAIVVVCEKLIDLGILEEIISAFPTTELDKVNEMIKKMTENRKFIGQNDLEKDVEFSV